MNKQPALPLIFDLDNLTESELTFLINATFGVQINSSDAKLVSELQQRMIAILSEGKAAVPADEPIETAVV